MGIRAFLQEKYLQVQIATGSIFLFGWEKHAFRCVFLSHSLVGGCGRLTDSLSLSLSLSVQTPCSWVGLDW